MATVTPVRSHDVAAVWPQVEPCLTRVLAKIDSGNDLYDVMTKLQMTHQQLWKINDWDAIAITEITVFPLHKNLTVVYVSGEGMEDWLAALTDALKTFAAYKECKYIEFYGRDGWRKPTKRLGFENAFSVMRLAI